MKQRIQTSIIAFLIFIPLVIIGGIIFDLFVCLLAVIALIELTRMRKVTNYYVPVTLAILFLLLLILPEAAGILYGIDNSELIIAFVLIMLSYTVLVKNKFTFDDAGFILLSIIYVGMGFFYLIDTRDGQSASGLTNLFYALIVIWATDTGAYFFGRAFGKHKLWPRISPNKTVEGAVGGIVLSVLVGVIFHIAFPFSYDMMIVIVVTVLASITGQIGDLVESAFKRHYDVKIGRAHV